MKNCKRNYIVLAIITLLLVNSRSLFVPARADDDISEIQDKIEKYEDQKEKAEQQLETAQSSLSKKQNQINVTTKLISETESGISRKEAEIDNLEKRTELNKLLLEGYIQEFYFAEQGSVINLVASDKSISQMSENGEQMLGIKQKILEILEDIEQSKKDSELAKEELSDKKENHEKLLSVQKGQQYEIKQDINEAQATIGELNSKINKLRGELSSLLGKEVSFKNIMDAAKFAAKVTGVRKDYLLGVLVVESNLGRYTGGCNFKESRMSGSRAEIFKGICKDLDYDYKKMKVSCPPSGYKGTGGAMGVAQFMPDTWVGYKSSIASVVNHTPDPWNLTDGVVAMALKLSKVSGVTAHKKDAEAKAYCVYLAGGNWASYCDNSGANYGAKVLYWADNYEKLMD